MISSDNMQSDEIKRYFLWLSYDGTNYNGWQIQPNGTTIQEEIQKALSIILQENIAIVGAGRTDTGVHARTMAAHFDTKKTIDCVNLTYRLNSILPKDISINNVVKVESTMHARFSATARKYHYYIHKSKNPFIRNYSLEIRQELNFDLMNQAAQLLFNYSNFGAFCKSNSGAKTMICKIYEAEWIKVKNDEYYFNIKANRFLRNMVRAITGTLLEVGKGKINLQQFKEIIEKQNRSSAGESLPAHALFLENIEY